MNIRLSILNLIMPISKAIAKIHAPFTHKKISGVDFFVAKQFMKPGAVLLTKVEGELANLFIPGEFTHAAICSTLNGKVIEARTSGVVSSDLMDFMFTKDRVMILYPLFADESEMQMSALICESMVGKPYDFYFDPSNKAFYCSELIQFGYSRFGIWDKRKTLGVNTVLPVDFVESARSKMPKWKIVWDSGLI